MLNEKAEPFEPEIFPLYIPFNDENPENGSLG
jgi:hypothetical protein